MSDFTVSVKLQAVDGDISGLRAKVEKEFASPINVKFSTGDLSKVTQQKASTSGIVSAVSAQKALGQSYDVSAKKSRSETAEITKQTAAIRLQNAQRLQAQRLVSDGNAARDKAFKTEAAFIRLQNQARSFYTKNQANISDKGGDAAWRASIAKYGDATQWVSAAEAQADYLRQQKSWVEQGVTGQTKMQKATAKWRETTDFNKLEDQARDYYNTNTQNINKNAVLSARWQNIMSKLQDPKNFGGIGDARAQFSQLVTESERAGVSIESVGQRLNRLFGAHLNTALVMAALHGLQQAVVTVYQNVVDLDKATVDLQIASGKSRSEVQDMVRGYSQTAKSLGATTLEVAQGADNFLRQGKTVAETNTLLQNSMMLSKLGQIDAAQASSYLTSTMKGYKISVEDSIGIVDKLTAVDMSAAISAGDIAEGLARTSVGADIAGVSLNKLIGYVASVGEVTQTSGDEVGRECA